MRRSPWWRWPRWRRCPGCVSPVDRLGDNLAYVAESGRRFEALPAFIERAGGRAAVLRCGQVVTGPFNTQALAYRLHTRQARIALRPVAPGSVLDTAISARGAGNRAFTVKQRDTEWILRQTC